MKGDWPSAERAPMKPDDRRRGWRASIASVAAEEGRFASRTAGHAGRWRWRWRWRWRGLGLGLGWLSRVLVLVISGLTIGAVRAAEVADDWLEVAPAPAPSPALAESGRSPRNEEGAGWFDGVSARLQQGWLEVTWPAPEGVKVTAVSVGFSTGAPGHWEVRDWREWPMNPAGSGASAEWVARLPVMSVRSPLIYHLRASIDGVPGTARFSRYRRFLPREAGMTEPTFPFLGHLDGFEQGLAGWEGIASRGADASLSVSTNAWSGKAALRVVVPPGRGSVTVGTVRVQGWMLSEYFPKALGVAARTEGGGGRLWWALHSHARTPELAVHPATRQFELGPEWRRVETKLGDFVQLRPGSVDWLTIQFFAEGGTALLLDDLELVVR